jgi:hypothetical protein
MRCKGTTKTAHIQIFGVFFCIIEHYSVLWAAICCIWSAGRERSYEGIGFISGALVWGIKAKADVRRYKKNDIRNTHAIFNVLIALFL